MAQDFGEWLKQRAHNRGQEPARSPIQIKDGHWLSVDWIGTGMVALFAVVSVAGCAMFERYTMGRDVLQVGSGMTAAFTGLIVGLLMVFAGIRGLLAAPKATIPLLVIFVLIGGGLAGAELQQKAEDLERAQRGERVPALELKKARQ